MSRSTSAAFRGTTSGPELPLDLRAGEGPLAARAEAALREAVGSGRLAPGRRLPSTRTLARDAGVSRRVVVEAYEQLTAEGLLEARRGAGTFVAAGRARAAGLAEPPPLPGPPGRLPYDFFAGAPDLSAFPRGPWVRALREVLAHAPADALHYPDARGSRDLRSALAAHLARVRGVATSPERLVVVTGARQALAVTARALRDLRGAPPRIAVEWPTIPVHLDVLRAAGAEVVRVPVDEEGLRVARLRECGAHAVVVTPAHQAPMGVALSPARRTALVAWAGETGGLIVEDDYDAEFRYDRRPVGALQPLAPESVAYVGSASKTLAPGLRLGWLAAPAALVEAAARAKALEDGGSGVLDQLVLARLLDTAAYDRHLRLARRANRRRRDALAAALEREIPGTRLEGLAAGLHALARLPVRPDAAALEAACRRRGTGVHAIPGRDGRADALVLGYAALSEPAIAEGVRRLAAAVREVEG